MTPEKVLLAIGKAKATVSDLCHQRKRWEMSIPARPDVDPDLVIGDALREAAALIENLTAERDALAEQLKQMLDALDSIIKAEHSYPLESCFSQAESAWEDALQACRDALALTPTEAETTARENASKAAEYDAVVAQYGDPEEEQTLTEVVKDVYTNGEEGWGRAGANAEKAAEYDKMTLTVFAANAERDHLKAKAEANEEAAQAFERLAEACGAETSVNGHGFPIANVLQTALDNLVQRRRKAEDNASKAALLEALIKAGRQPERRQKEEPYD